MLPRTPVIEVISRRVVITAMVSIGFILEVPEDLEVDFAVKLFV